MQYTRQLIDEGRLGELTHYRGRFFSMYGRDRLGLLSWRFKQDEAGYGALADIMSHAIDMANFISGPIKRVVATREIFVKQRPLPTPGKGTHYDRGKPDDPTGEVTNEDYVGALVEFENGHVQPLPFAWDTRTAEEGGQRWFHLYPDEYIGPDDPLFWTGREQNWNYMCSECHSTNVRKNYDYKSKTYRTSWN